MCIAAYRRHSSISSRSIEPEESAAGAGALPGRRFTEASGSPTILSRISAKRRVSLSTESRAYKPLLYLVLTVRGPPKSETSSCISNCGCW